MTAPLSIEQWRSLAAKGWSEWKSALDEAWSQIPSADAKRAVSFTFPEDDIEAFWRDGISNRSHPLAGVPCAWKDLFDITGAATMAGSIFLPEVCDIPEAHAPAVRQGLDLGLVPVAKTHLNEFAYGLSGENPHFGNCPHPRFPERVSGGSSSGSAYIVGKGILPVAFGTDTGGSIRAPAAYCGLYGYRHVPGEWLAGCFPLAPSFDTFGWFTGNPEDMLAMLRAWNLAAEDSRDPPRSFTALFPEDFPYTDSFRSRMDALPVDTLLEAREWSPLLSDALRAFVIIQSKEAFEIHRRWFDDRRDQYDLAVWKRIARGRDWSDDSIQWAKNCQVGCRKRLDEILGDGPLLMPAVPTPAPLLGELNEDFRNRSLTYTVLASLAGKACLTLPIPCGELTLGLQVILPDPADAIPTLESLLGNWKALGINSPIVS